MHFRTAILILFHICIGAKMLHAQTSPYKRSAQLSRQLLQYDVNLYALDVNISNTSNYISGSGTIKATVTATKLDTFAFELHQNLTIDSIYINSQKYLVNSSRTNGEVQVKLQNAINKNTAITAVVFYRGNPPSTVNTWKLGLINETDTKYGVQITHSLSVPYSAYEWWPCKQVVTDLADSLRIFVTTDTSLKVASNGKLHNITDVGNGKHRFEWKSAHEINYYLVSVAVAPYFINEYKGYINNGSQSVDIQDYIYNTERGRTESKVSETSSPVIMEKFSEMFGTYPFADEKYGIYSAPVSGGMEHQTMSAIGNITDKYLLAHEMAHQWWGDNVNLVSYRDMWLNEGFASYAEYLAAEKIWPADASVMMQNYHAIAMSRVGGSVYVNDTLEFDQLYEGRLVYRKGAAIIHTLRFLVNNDANFFAALRSYQDKFSGKNVTLQDFKKHMETETAVNLDRYFQQWYYGEGYPTFTMTWNHKNDTLKLRSIQTTSSAKTMLFKTPYELLVKRMEGDTIIRLFQDTNTTYYTVPLKGNVSGISVDPNNWILNKVKSVTKDINLSVPKNAKSTGYNFRVYPNPANEKLYIDAVENASGYEKLRLEITQIDGKVCLLQQFSTPKLELDLQFLTTGIYFLSITGEKGSYRQKLVKN